VGQESMIGLGSGSGSGSGLGVKKIFPKEGWTSWSLLRSHLNVKLEISMLSFSSSNTKIFL
jgi:hypothetical protein